MKNSVVSGSTAAATSLTGMAQAIDLIPDNIGKAACLLGMCASFVVIIVQFSLARKAKAETEKIRLEIKQMEKSIKD